MLVKKRTLHKILRICYIVHTFVVHILSMPVHAIEKLLNNLFNIKSFCLSAPVSIEQFAYNAIHESWRVPWVDHRSHTICSESPLSSDITCRYIVIWLKEDGDWKYHWDIWNPDSLPPEELAKLPIEI